MREERASEVQGKLLHRYMPNNIKYIVEPFVIAYFGSPPRCYVPKASCLWLPPLCR